MTDFYSLNNYHEYFKKYKNSKIFYLLVTIVFVLFSLLSFIFKSSFSKTQFLIFNITISIIWAYFSLSYISLVVFYRLNQLKHLKLVKNSKTTTMKTKVLKKYQEYETIKGIQFKKIKLINLEDSNLNNLVVLLNCKINSSNILINDYLIVDLAGSFITSYKINNNNS